MANVSETETWVDPKRPKGARSAARATPPTSPSSADDSVGAEFIRVGSEVVISLNFTNDSDAPIDPATIVLTIHPPRGNAIAYEKADLTAIATGRFVCIYIVADAGEHVYTAQATGGVQASMRGSFTGLPL